jgi:hypothetical protein
MAQSAAASEASLSTDIAKDIDRRQAAHGIFIHRGDIPELLRKHIEEVVMDMRKPDTPSAARLARNSRRARGMNEPQGKELLAADLLFKTEIDDGEELIQVLPEVTFGRQWLPVAPAEWVERQYGALEQPRPDHAVGYITQQDAYSMDPRSKAALQRAEEDKITRWAASSLRSSRIAANTIYQTCVDYSTAFSVSHLPMEEPKKRGRPLSCFATGCARRSRHRPQSLRLVPDRAARTIHRRHDAFLSDHRH